MKTSEASRHINGTFVAGREGDREVLGGYASDLLSDVMANSREGDLWVTLQKHVNIIAVAQLNGLSGIVLVNGRTPEPDAVARAEEAGLPLISTKLQAFDVIGILYSLGIRGRRQI
ncbi:MAG: serine kinase [Acidobacteria bacterium]|nr:serine kinase [Acidobacteriota bacterium]